MHAAWLGWEGEKRKNGHGCDSTGAAQDLVNRGTAPECTPDDGWCLPGTLAAIRERINAILSEIATKPHAPKGECVGAHDICA